MRRAAVLLSLLFLASACNLPRRGVPAFALTEEPAPAATVPYEACGWQWAAQALPDLSAQVQAALEAAGLEGATVRAEAYGENCLSADNEVLRFAALETDFRISLEVGSLADREYLGTLLEKILIVLDGFPPGATPGPQPGYIGIRFAAGAEELNLWFTVTDSEAARALGLHGSALLEELQNR